MNAMRNKVQLIGHVGQEPEIKTFDGGKKVVNFTLATNEVYKNEKGEKVEQTEWHRVSAWGKVADIIEGNDVRKAVAQCFHQYRSRRCAIALPYLRTLVGVVGNKKQRAVYIRKVVRGKETIAAVSMPYHYSAGLCAVALE